jgi:hypothetical protein
MTIKLGLIEIERKTDILAFAAFLISVGSLIYQLNIYVKGAEIHFIDPEIITLTNIKYSDAGDSYLTIIAPMAYVNSGSAGYNSAVKKEKISFEVSKEEYELVWQHFVSTYSEKEKMIYKITDGAHPFVIEGGNAMVHETHFYPHYVQLHEETSSEKRKSFLKLDSFINGFKDLLSEGQTKKMKLKLKFTIEILGEKNMEAEYITYLQKEDLWALMDPSIGWASLSCWPAKGDS